MKNRYEIVACVGDPWDYTYELVDVVFNWKEARRLESLGAKVFLNGERVRFIDHASVQEAFDDLAFDEIAGFDIIDTNPNNIEARNKRLAILKQNGITIDETYRAKVVARYMNLRSIEEPFFDRKCLLLINGKYVSGKVETENLPFWDVFEA